mgnify:CR=1 FL=1
MLNPVITEFRPIYQGTIITNSGYDLIISDRILGEGNADSVSFGKLFISNPDLPKRLQLNAQLNSPDQKTFYAPDATGYTDYPFLES